MRRSRRGSVLLQVMILGIIVAFLAAGMAAMLLMRGSATERIRDGNTASRANTGVLSNLIYGWGSNSGKVCTAPVPGCSFVSGANSCNCSLQCNWTVEGIARKVDVVVKSNAGQTWPVCNSAITVTY